MKPLVKHNTRFNLFDALLLILILLCVAALIFFLLPSGARQSATFTVRCTGVRAELLSLFGEGDLVYDRGGNTLLGKITDISTERDTLSYTDDETGEMHEVPYPVGSYYCVTLTVSTVDAFSSESDEALTLGTTRIAPNEMIGLRTARVTTAGVCTDISVQNGGQK